MIQVLPLLLLAQEGTNPPQPDEAMDIFLLIIAGLFISAMLGAAIIGAFLAAFAILLLICLFSFGIISASFAIGLYKRSATAGFKSLLFLFFGSICTILGWASLVIFTQFVPLQLSGLQLTLIGLSAGLIGGILLACITFRVLKELFSWFAKKGGEV